MHLKPSQIVYRVINKIKRSFYKLKLLKIHIPLDIKTIDEFEFIISYLDFDKEYLNRFNTCGIMENEFEFINIKHKVSLKDAWNNKKLQHLWRYNLHYFEYLYKLSFEYLNDNKNLKYYEKYKELILSWIINNPYPYGDGWHPYTISLRVANWISTYVIFKNRIEKDSSFKKQLVESLYLQYIYLYKNLEKDVLGNHYFENIKALLIGSIFFEDGNVKSKFTQELFKQLEEQILEDGMHFELTPMYHKIILEDLIKITVWFREEAFYDELCGYVQRMVDVMYSLEAGFGKTPAFNDSTDGISKSYKCLLETCKQEFSLNPNFVGSLTKSGYYIICNDKYKLIFDCGEICPSYLPAHGHCDALSYELSIDGTPILVNSGTYQYESGQWRDYFRKTKAHNTVTIDEKEQSQFWGSFRVANRINDVKRSQFSHKGIDFIHGSYKTYFGAIHNRFIGVINEDLIIVLDEVKAKENEEVRSYIHIAPNMKVELDKSVILKDESMCLRIIPVFSKDVLLQKGWYSKAFNVKEENNHFVITKSEDSRFFGYIICLSEIDCNVEMSNNELIVSTDRKFTINLNQLGDQK